MLSQSSDIQNVGGVDSRARSPANIASKSTNNQIVAMTRRKQGLTLAHQMKSSSTTDLTVANVQNKITSTPTKSTNIGSAPANVVAHSKPQQTNTVRQLPRAIGSTVSPSNGQTEIGDDHSFHYQRYTGPAISPSYTTSPATVSLNMSSPHIGNQLNQHSNYHTQYANQVQQSQQGLNEMGNRYNSNRHNGSVGNNKKGYNPNYNRTKRNGNGSNNSSSTASVKAYNTSNNNNNYMKNNNNYHNNNNNNEYERNTGNKSSGHVSEPITRSGEHRSSHRSFNSDTTISPSRDHYSSSSSSSSTSSAPINKKRDSRTSPPSHSDFKNQICIVRQLPSNLYVENGHNAGYPLKWPYPECPYSRSMQQQQQYYTNPSNGEILTMTNVIDGKSNNQRLNKPNRVNQKSGHSAAKRYTPPDRYVNRAPHVEVKEPPKELTNGNKWDHLSIQVWDKFIKFQQKEGTYTKKMIMWKTMHCFVQQSFPGYTLYVVGSTISGFGTDVSDVDMCLVDSTKTGQMYYGNDLRLHSAKILKHFEELLSRQNIYDKFHLIPAKVPILRFRDTFHDCDVDLNYNNYVGVQNTHLMNCYGGMDWRLRPLALVVKLWAQFHRINNAKEMTISSYSLVLMVIHFLQYAVNPPVLPCLHDLYPNKFQKYQEIKTIDMHEDLAPWYSQNNQTLGDLFFEFFNYYAHFDFANKAISVRKGCTVSIESCKNNPSPKNDPNQWKELCIEEPFDFTNTAHSCYDPCKFQWIKHVFNTSYHELLRTKNLESLFKTEFMPWSFHHTL